MASRFYLSNSEVSGVPNNPAFAGTWGETASARRRLMDTATAVDALTTVAVATTTPGNSVCHMQLISRPMEAGIAFVTTDTFSIQVEGLESAINDNIINRMRALRVFSQDGLTVQATLRGLGAGLSVVEWNTTLRNLTFATAVVFSNNYTTVAGDRLVLELGHQDSAGASVSGSMRWGRDSSGTGDLGQNETDTTTTLRPWLEISRDITFLKTGLDDMGASGFFGVAGANAA